MKRGRGGGGGGGGGTKERCLEQIVKWFESKGSSDDREIEARIRPTTSSSKTGISNETARALCEVWTKGDVESKVCLECDGFYSDKEGRRYRLRATCEPHVFGTELLACGDGAFRSPSEDDVKTNGVWVSAVRAFESMIDIDRAIHKESAGANRALSCKSLGLCQAKFGTVFVELDKSAGRCSWLSRRDSRVACVAAMKDELGADRAKTKVHFADACRIKVRCDVRNKATPNWMYSISAAWFVDEKNGCGPRTNEVEIEFSPVNKSSATAAQLAANLVSRIEKVANFIDEHQQPQQ